MSWNGTVRCGNCHESGHNRTGCPELKKAFDADPNSYCGREWARHQARKQAPKTCSYCKESGHTRAGCAEMKQHKLTFRQDAILFRKALAKWMRDSGLAVGALVRAQDTQYYTDEGYCYPGGDDYIPPVGMVMNVTPNATHYSAISGSAEWMNAGSFLTMETLGAQSADAYHRNVGLSLPCIPGIIPRMGKDWYGGIQDRQDRSSGINWEVVSAGYQHFDSTNWTAAPTVKALVKEHFAGPNEQESKEFRAFTDERRQQLSDYIVGSIDLSEMIDPELPEKDS